MEMRLEKKALDKLFRRRDRIDIPEFQRKQVWSIEKKQAFMDTILKKWFVPVVFLRVVDEQHYECIDGQQRLNAIFGFYNNEYPLSKKYSGKYGGYYYENLPDNIKDIFDDYELYIVEIRDPEEGEVEELFQRLQLGVPLNAGEKLNALMGDMRDFAVELSKHEFFEKKVYLKNYRFAFLSICSQTCLLELEGISDAKFKNLKSFYDKYSVFSKDSPKAKKILKVYDFMNRMFDSRVHELSNRASIVSLYLLISDLLNKTSLKGKENTLKEFYINFLSDLRNEVEKGPLAKDAELILYQSAVNQAADSKESIQRRHDILRKRLVDFDKDFEQFMDKDAIQDRLRTLEEEKAIKTLSTDIFTLISECNDIYDSKRKEHIFKITNKTLKRIADIAHIANTKDTFGNLIDALYEIIYESSGSLKRIPEEYKKDDFIGFDIKYLRTDLRHDIEHGDKAKIENKKTELAKIYEHYTGKQTLSSLGKQDYVKFQKKLMEKLKTFLVNLKEYCNKMDNI